MNKTKNGPVRGSEIISRLIEGAEKACREYIEISGRPSPGAAPESFIQAGAARALNKVKKTWVVLEESVLDAYSASQPPKRGPKKGIVSKGRYDIVAYWKSKSPRAAIEVKSPLNALVKQKYEKDFNRLIATMRGHPDASFQYGIFLFLTVKKGPRSNFSKASQKIDELVDKLCEKAAAKCLDEVNKQIKVFVHDGNTYPLQSETGSGAWRVTALVFKR